MAGDILKALHAYRKNALGNPPLSVTALAGSLGITPPVLQSEITKLIEQRLVETDSRHTVYRITDAGLNYVNRRTLA